MYTQQTLELGKWYYDVFRGKQFYPTRKEPFGAIDNEGGYYHYKDIVDDFHMYHNGSIVKIDTRKGSNVFVPNYPWGIKIEIGHHIYKVKIIELVTSHKGLCYYKVKYENYTVFTIPQDIIIELVEGSTESLRYHKPINNKKELGNLVNSLLNNKNHAIRLQKTNPHIQRGQLRGNSISCNRRHKTSVTSQHLSYKAISS